MIGSVYEWESIKTKEFSLFSKDSCFTDSVIY
ncbi:MAG: ADP-ribosylglycohydrolase [Spartobacteria bacterium]|nr:ADP-ribosylglycohydrolase [Spartobacteria bacterium]